MKKQILLVEDNPEVQTYNKKLLEFEGFRVKTAMSLGEAGALIGRDTPDAIVLDIGMPDGSGLDFLSGLRKTSRIPVLMLTGFDKSSDIVDGFKRGCDDYLPKPYTFEVLLMRLIHLLQSAEQIPETLIKGKLTLKPASMTALVEGKDLNLSPKDYLLLQFLAQNAGELLTPDNIYENVWGQMKDNDSKALGIAVPRLRKKLKGSGYTISNEYGSGYRFESGEA